MKTASSASRQTASASRLRRYYAGAGSGDPIRIVLPPGGYRPNFEQAAPAHDADLASRAMWGRRSTLRFPKRTIAAAAVVLVVVGAAAAYLGWRYGAGRQLVEPPIIAIGEIKPLGRDREFSYLADGVRSLLVTDMSQFRTLRVRLAAIGDADETSHPDLERADFRISGFISRPGDMFRLHLILVDARTNEVLWSVDRIMPNDHAGLREQFVHRIRQIIGELASPAGALMAEEIRRMDARGEDHSAYSEYACLLRWHAYDLTKDADRLEPARDCLEAHIQSRAASGEIWAAWAVMQLLEASRRSGPEAEDLLDKALAAAEQAIRLDPLGAAGHEYRGAVLQAMRRPNEALESYVKAIRYNPSKPDLKAHLGWVMAGLGRWEDAAQALQEAVAASPAPPAWYRIPLSMNAFRTGDYLRAFREAETIWRSGDARGAPLALAAAIKLGDEASVERFGPIVDDVGPDPMGRIGSMMNTPNLIDEYRAVLAERQSR